MVSVELAKIMTYFRGRDRFNKNKTIFNLISKIFTGLPLFLRKKLLQNCSSMQGLKGIAIRYALLKTIAIECGDNVAINQGVFIFSPEKLKIGSNVSIHPMCYIDASGGIEIGNDVSIAHGATIMSTTHTYFNLNIPIKDQPCLKKKTRIEDNVWIGAKAVIIAGVKLSKGSVVGAGAVVTKNVPENSISGGVPAKIIKIRI